VSGANVRAVTRSRHLITRAARAHFNIRFQLRAPEVRGFCKLADLRETWSIYKGLGALAILRRGSPDGALDSYP